MPRKGKKTKTIQGYFLGEQVSPPLPSDEEEWCSPSGEDTEVSASTSQPTQWDQFWEKVLKSPNNFQNYVREVEEKLGRAIKVLQVKYEQQISTLLKVTQKNAEENIKQ